MMNVKYIFVLDKKGGMGVQENLYVNGFVWFVEGVMLVNNVNEEILNLDSLDIKKIVVIYKDYLDKIFVKDVVCDLLVMIDIILYKFNRFVYEILIELD